MDFFERTEYSLQDLNDFVELEVEESTHLDYKDGAALSPDKISEITKDVSSFANSDGGIIIYGVGENKETHVPSYYAPITNAKISKEWLEQKINIIQPNIKGLQIFPIRLNKKATKSIYIVKIPRSDDAPHMAEDRRYYYRGNFISEAMQSYQVRDTFNRISTPLLKLFGADLFYLEHSATGRNELFFKTFVQNERKAVAKLYKVNVYIFTKTPVDDISIIPTNSSTQICSLTKMDSQSVRIGMVPAQPIFKSECVEVGNFFVYVPDELKEEFYDTAMIRIVLLYEAGATELLFIPKGHSLIKGKNAIDAAIKEQFPNYRSEWL